MRRALLMFREGLHYRRECFSEGLRANGFEVFEQHPHHSHKFFTPTPDDVLVIWNRYGAGDAMAMEFEANKAAVIVVENGYLGKHWLGRDWYAMSRNHHNGAGKTPYNGPGRWASLGFELAPYRERGQEIVLLPQRGIGEKGVAMPAGWSSFVVEKINIAHRTRQHPGKSEALPVEIDCQNAAGVVTWGSGAAIKCLAAGIRCVSTWPQWIAAGACTPIDRVTAWHRPEINWLALPDVDRLPTFERLAWAQWTIDEVKNGEAICALLSL